MQFSCLFLYIYIYIYILEPHTTYIPNMLNCRYLFIFVPCFFVSLCKIQDMSKNTNTILLLQHLQVNFLCSVLFTWWKVTIRKKNYSSNHEKVSKCSLKCRSFLHMNKKETSFFLGNCTLVWSESFFNNGSNIDT